MVVASGKSSARTGTSCHPSFPSPSLGGGRREEGGGKRVEDGGWRVGFSSFLKKLCCFTEKALLVAQAGGAEREPCPDKRMTVGGSGCGGARWALLCWRWSLYLTDRNVQLNKLERARTKVAKTSVPID